jgi:hypothetical protein
MSKSNAWETALLGLLFNATAVANIADNAAASPLTDLYVSLHTADPGEGGNQQSNEANYGSYARLAVARSGSGWTVSGNQVTPVAAIEFPQASSGSNTITHFGIGTAPSGAGVLLYSGTVAPSINVTTGVTPRLTTATQVTED